MMNVKVGMMPGKINEYVIEDGTTVNEVLEIAGLNPEGYDTKVDGVKVTDLNAPLASSAALVLLVKQVKGNASTVKVGMMPGKINEYAVENGATISQVLELASLNPEGYEVKVDGVKYTDLNTTLPEGAGLILLVAQVKGNK